MSHLAGVSFQTGYMVLSDIMHANEGGKDSVYTCTQAKAAFTNTIVVTTASQHWIAVWHHDPLAFHGSYQLCQAMKVDLHNPHLC